jgi:chondroitin synthase
MEDRAPITELEIALCNAIGSKKYDLVRQLSHQLATKRKTSLAAKRHEIAYTLGELKSKIAAVEERSTTETIGGRQDFAEFLEHDFKLSPFEGKANDYRNLLATGKKKISKEISLSIIITTYNNQDLLRICLASIYRAMPDNLKYEVIISDDGSDRDLSDIFIEYATRLSLSWVRNQDSGYKLAAARNNGARTARHSHLLFLDADILISREFIQEIIRIHSLCPRAITTGIRRFANQRTVSELDILLDKISVGDIKPSRSANPWYATTNKQGVTDDWRQEVFDKTDYLALHEKPYDFFNGGHSCVQREFFFLVGAYNEIFNSWGYEDREFAYRGFTHGGYIIPIKDAQTVHIDSCRTEENNACHRRRIEGNPRSLQTYHRLVPPSRNGGEVINDPEIQQNPNASFTWTPFFSIYIPAFRAEKYLDATITSVLSQDFKDYEIIIALCPKSCDGTNEIASRFATQYFSVRLIYSTDHEIGPMTHAALSASSGEWIVQLDSDDLLEEKALSSLSEYIRKNDNCDLIYSDFSILGNNSIKQEGWSPDVFNFYCHLIGMSIPHLRAFKRRLWHLIDQTILQTSLETSVDYRLYLDLAYVARVAKIGKKLYIYRQGSDNSVTKATSIQRRLNNHRSVVTQFLASIGLDEYHARGRDRFKPFKNYIVKKSGSSLSLPNKWKLSERVDAGTYKKIIDRLAKLQVSPGNNYQAIKDQVNSYWAEEPGGQVNAYTERVTIIVPAYNRFKRLANCLASIYSQTYPRDLISIVVVDDGSNDEIYTIIRKYEQILDLRYYKQPDYGFRLSAVRNIGINLAKTDNIAIIDCDLMPLPNFIESLMRYLHVVDNAILLGHQRFVEAATITDNQIIEDSSVLYKLRQIKADNPTMPEENGISVDFRYNMYKETNDLKDSPYPFLAFSSGHVAYKKKAIIEAGMYDEEFTQWGCEDNEAGYRLMKKGYYFIPVLDAIDLHQEPENSSDEADRLSARKYTRQLLQEKCPPVRGWFGDYIPEPTRIEVPAITIGIPTYNSEAYLKSCIESALAQDFSSFEILVYDDASTDSTPDILKEYEAKSARIRVIYGEINRGAYYARYTLLEEAHGEILLFLDSDDLITPDCTAVFWKFFSKQPNTGLVTSEYTVIDEHNNHICDGYSPIEYTKEGMLMGNIFTHMRGIRIRDWNRCRKPTIPQILYFRYAEDYDICLRLAEVAEIGRINQALYCYRRPVNTKNTGITDLYTSSNKGTQLTVEALNLFLRRIGVQNVICVSTCNAEQPFEITYIDG